FHTRHEYGGCRRLTLLLIADDIHRTRAWYESEMLHQGWQLRSEERRVGKDGERGGAPVQLQGYQQQFDKGVAGTVGVDHIHQRGGHVDVFFFPSRRRHTRFSRDWSSDVCSSDLFIPGTSTVDVVA